MHTQEVGVDHIIALPFWESLRGLAHHLRLPSYLICFDPLIHAVYFQTIFKADPSPSKVYDLLKY